MAYKNCSEAERVDLLSWEPKKAITYEQSVKRQTGFRFHNIAVMDAVQNSSVNARAHPFATLRAWTFQQSVGTIKHNQHKLGTV